MGIAGALIAPSRRIHRDMTEANVNEAGSADERSIQAESPPFDVGVEDPRKTSAP